MKKNINYWLLEDDGYYGKMCQALYNDVLYVLQHSIYKIKNNKRLYNDIAFICQEHIR